MQIWTSGTDLGKKNDFIWFSNGRSILMHDKWETNRNQQPQLNKTYACPASENCVILSKISGSNNFGLKATPCLDNNIFLCEFI